MKYILEASNLKVLEALPSDDTLYAFDFDGTLSSIVTLHYQATASEVINKLMTRLCKLVPVAIISGRSVADLKRIINFTPKFLIGNHGLEGILSKEELDSIEMKCSDWQNYLIKNFSSDFEDNGIELENKKYSFSLHYRKAPNPEDAEQMIFQAVALLLPTATIIKGKYVFNILTSSEFNKGSALKKLLKVENKKYSFFIGDDDTDEDIFKIIDPDCITVRVEKSHQSKAKFYINTQREVELLLAKIIYFLEEKN